MGLPQRQGKAREHEHHQHDANEGDPLADAAVDALRAFPRPQRDAWVLSLIHISEPTRPY